jgi:hypothetical protein
MLINASEYGLDRASPFDYLFYKIVGYLLLFFSKPLALILFMDAIVC